MVPPRRSKHVCVCACVCVHVCVVCVCERERECMVVYVYMFVFCVCVCVSYFVHLSNVHLTPSIQDLGQPHYQNDANSLQIMFTCTWWMCRIVYACTRFETSVHVWRC